MRTSAPKVASGQDVTVEDARSFKELKETPLYADRVPIYPKSVRGLFRRIKWAVLILLLGLYYIVPWIRWDRGPTAPDQAVLVDMPGRRLYFFWIEIWPQEIYYLTFLLIAAAFGLFLATAIGGRVWCGFTCPQTVWTDLFMGVERMIQGDRGARIRLDKQPWTSEKLWKKGATHAAWLLIAAATGGAWIMYFNDAPTVTYDILTGSAGLAVYFFFGLFTFTTYLLAGWAREQVCTYMCPWPRIQAALLDQDSYVVTYETWRGEPKGPHKKGASWEGRGDCVACNQCVAVCPMGIDIRDGLQLECIGCGLCVDACNEVMTRVDRPLNLITLDTERNQLNRAAGKPTESRLVRTRTIVYVAILAVLGIGVLLGLSGRVGLDLNVLPDRNPLFVKLGDGSIRNGYTVKVLNRVREPKTYALTLEGLEGATLSVLGLNEGNGPSAVLDGKPDQVSTYRLFVTAPPGSAGDAVNDIRVILTDQADNEAYGFDTVFRGPK
ncbi:MAG: cytochrome c oxidase accessory protein CcoG [Geminicoccaceae bacterium]